MVKSRFGQGGFDLSLRAKAGLKLRNVRHTLLDQLSPEGEADHLLQVSGDVTEKGVARSTLEKPGKRQVQLADDVKPSAIELK